MARPRGTWWLRTSGASGASGWIPGPVCAWSIELGGLERAPQAPRRSSRPGGAGALLESYVSRPGASNGPPRPPGARRPLPSRDATRELLRGRGVEQVQGRPRAEPFELGCAEGVVQVQGLDASVGVFDAALHGLVRRQGGEAHQAEAV